MKSFARDDMRGKNAADQGNKMLDGRLVDFENYKVLLVDDDRLIRDIMARMLAKIGFRDIQGVRCAEDAWTYLTEKGGDGEDVDIMITDLTLPGSSGLGLIRDLRQVARPKLRTLPVVVLTGSADPASQAQAESLGVASYLQKPITRDVLRDVMCRVLRPEVRFGAAYEQVGL